MSLPISTPTPTSPPHHHWTKNNRKGHQNMYMDYSWRSTRHWEKLSGLSALLTIRASITRRIWCLCPLRIAKATTNLQSSPTPDQIKSNIHYSKVHVENKAYLFPEIKTVWFNLYCPMQDSCYHQIMIRHTKKQDKNHISKESKNQHNQIEIGHRCWNYQGILNDYD